MTFVCKNGKHTTFTEKFSPNVRQWSMLFVRVWRILLVACFLMSTTLDTAWSTEAPPAYQKGPRMPLTGHSSACPGRCPQPGRLSPLNPRSDHQCLLLDDALKDTFCEGHVSPSNVHLPYCTCLTLDQVMPVITDRAQCRSEVRRMLEVDTDVQRQVRGFVHVLERYDCQTGYSVNWMCKQCEEAYRVWVCAMQLPFHVNGQRVRPCRSFCHKVEQRCPYFHPFVKDQYAGEPTFKCIDRNIPDLPSITPNSSYGSAGQCYEPCHMSRTVSSDSSCPALPQLVLPNANISTWTEPSGAYSSCAQRQCLSLYLVLAVTFCRTLVTFHRTLVTFHRTPSRTRLDLGR